MLIFLFLFWIVLVGNVSAHTLIYGLVISAALYAFMRKFMDYSPKREIRIIKNAGRILKYTCLLVSEIIKANLAVAKVILSFDTEPEPVLVRFKTPVATNDGKTLLANSITLTPGTVTVDIDDDIYLVHALDREFGVGIDNSDFVSGIMDLERGGEDA